MKKKTKIIILILTIGIIIATTVAIIMLSNEKNNWNNEFSQINKNEIDYNENANVEELKEEMKLEASSDLYEVTEEYDGRKTLNIKADILYKVAFVGIVKNNKPTFEEIDTIFNEKYPEKNGIWISEQSRDRFLNLIKENTNSVYVINNDGYLKIQEKNENINDIDKKLENVINSNNTIIVDINSFDYDVDTVTGEIVEYPFEQLGDLMDVIKNRDNDKIMVITTNKNKKYSAEEILNIFINNI